MTIYSSPGVLFLVAAWALLASAQSTTTYSTSTSWALLDNTDLFPKHTSTASPSAAVTTTTANDADADISTTTTPTATTTGDGFQITPPIPCPGLYYTYGGVCCAGNQMLDCDYDELYDGQQQPSSCCPAGQFVWALPLSEQQIADARARGDYSGCPGNMRNGVCCSGGVIYRDDDDAEVCSLGSVVWVAVTEEGGKVVTSSVPPSSSSSAAATTTATTTDAGVRTVTSSRAGAAATGGASLPGGSWAVDGRAWWGVVLAMGGAF